MTALQDVALHGVLYQRRDVGNRGPNCILLHHRELVRKLGSRSAVDMLIRHLVGQGQVIQPKVQKASLPLYSTEMRFGGRNATVYMLAPDMLDR